MIKLTITGQTLSIVTSKVVAGTHDYLEVEGDFRTPDWENLRKWVHFIKDELEYILPMHDDRIRAEQHLDITAGTWDVYVHGNYIDDDEVTERVTTGIRHLWVEGPHDGHPFPELTPDLSEILANDVEQALDIAQSVRDDADAGVFDGATFLPNVDEDGIISWTNNKDLPNPEPRDITGPQGPVGNTTVMVSDTPPEDPRINVWINPNGQVGKVVVSFEQISGTHQPGTYDTYRMTFQDSTYLDMQVYNGVDGEGTGDMVKAVYDPTNKATDVFAYADEAAEDAADAVKDTTGVNGLLKGSGGSIVPAVAGTDYQTPLTIDTAMSGSSTNPVQNKIIKSYIDNNASKIFIVRNGITTYAEISAALSDGKIPIIEGSFDAVLACTITAGTTRYYVFATPVIFQNQKPRIYAQFVDDDDNWSSKTTYLISEDYVDAALSSASTNPVQNKAVYNALQGKQDRLTIDTAMSSVSTNPVQNRAIKQALDGKASTSQIPTSLKNPYALTIVKDGVTTTYDGSQAKSITIPSGGGGGITVLTSLTQTSLSSGINRIFIPDSVWRKTGYVLVGLVGVLVGYDGASIYGFHGSQSGNAVWIDVYSNTAISAVAIQIDGLYVPA